MMAAFTAFTGGTFAMAATQPSRAAPRSTTMIGTLILLTLVIAFALVLPAAVVPAFGTALAVNLAPRLGANPSQLVIDMALGAKDAVRALNAQNFGIQPAAPAPQQQ